MKILLASAEAVPFAKVGGLADVVPLIARSVTGLGHEVHVVLPLYASIDRTNLTHCDQPMIVNMGYGIEFCRLWKTTNLGVEFLFIEFDRYFGRAGIYGENGEGYRDNWERFSFFSRAAIDLCDFTNWIPDVIHSHDWHTGLIPVMLREQRVYRLSKSASVFTIHNMAHHGYSPRGLLNFVGLPEKLFHPFALEAFGAINIMKGAILYADKITAVSQTYADEIKTTEHGCGLNDPLMYRAADLIGICNAVDSDIWSPKNDPLIPAKFSHNNLAGKGKCKLALQEKVGLNVDENILLIGVISRLVEQKGLDMVCDILPELLDNLHIQFVLLGAGDSVLEDRFRFYTNNYGGRVAVKIGYDNSLSHMIEASADCFLMPSRYEPCGMNQMYSMLYGTLPIVHATGGLRDTVENYDEQSHIGSGFVFHQLDHRSLYNTVCWACATYYDRKQDFVAMQKYAMQKDFSMNKMANAYLKVYEYSLKAHERSR
ncbi:MAG: glycogen synthase GlgA [Puniceicoccales bacterium]|jgi:starch synthase|nr:glycogen synthase GlgA [Puniceicoccales bacterium]